MNTFKEIYKQKSFRVCSTAFISDGKIKYYPLNKCLSIERLQKDNSYYVVAMIKTTDKGETLFEDCSFRSVEMLSDLSINEITEYLNCAKFAKEFMIRESNTIINKNKEYK